MKQAALHARRLLGTLAMVAVLAGCAAAPAAPPRTMQPGDLRLLAGTWRGSTNVQGEVSVSIEAVVNENGSFYTRPRGGGDTTPGTMRIVDGGIRYETATSQGTMTFHEGSTEWVWKWQGTTRTGGRTVQHELTKSK